MGKVVGKLFGGSAKPAAVSKKSTDATEAEKRKAKTGRSALYETQGGVQGTELNPDEVKRRQTLLGN